MIRGSGDEQSSTYSQTLNRCEIYVASLYEHKINFPDSYAFLVDCAW